MITRRPAKQHRPTRPLRGQTPMPTYANALRLAILRTQPPVPMAIPRFPPLIDAKYDAKLQAIAVRSQSFIEALIKTCRQQGVLAKQDAKEPDNSEEFTLAPLEEQPGYAAPAALKTAAERVALTQAAQLLLPLPVKQAIGLMRSQLTAYSVDLQAHGIAQPIADAIERHGASVNVQIAKKLGIQAIEPKSVIAKARNRWVADNASLIKSIPTVKADRAQAIVQQMVENGQRWETIAKQLEKELQIGKNRAQLIARDQVSKYNGALNQANQRAAGINRYAWRGVKDNRERPEHLALEGQVFSWDQPSHLGNPGEPIRCRCWAEPVTSDSVKTSPQLSEQDLINRTAAQGPKQSMPGATPAEVHAEAERSVKAAIKLAENRQRLLGR